MLSSSEYGPGVYACDEMPFCDSSLTPQSCSLVMLQNSIAPLGSKSGAAVAAGWKSQSQITRERSGARRSMR